MEDKDIKEMFEAFEPNMKPDFEFMSQLKRAMDSVEMIRERQIAFRRRQHRAMAVAIATGFLTGIVFTLLLSMSTAPVHTDHIIACISRPRIDPIWYWMGIGILSLIATFSAYDVALGLQRPSAKVNMI